MNDIRKEEWRPVVGYEETHLVSSLGQVYSLLCKKMLSPYISNKGYCMVMLNRGKKDRHGKTVHRLVAEAFIENPNNYPSVNHKDENKLNNCVDNLEWCTPFYNNKYSNLYEKAVQATRKTVYQYDLSWKLVNVYTSTREVNRTHGYSAGNIGDACNNPQKVRYGFHWSYTPLV